jgi:hypothetical protein
MSPSHEPGAGNVDRLWLTKGERPAKIAADGNFAATSSR